MRTFEGLEENLRFLVSEVENQIHAIQTFLVSPSRELYERITSKDDYIDNLKTIIENKCFSKIHTESLEKAEINKIRSIQTIGVNLERIADFCVNIVRQMGYLEDYRVLDDYAYETAFSRIQNSLTRILAVFHEKDLAGALSICKTEHALDEVYKARFDRIMGEIRDGADAQQLITVLFIFRYLERIGDSLLNIGEALIFNILGERIKIEQFEALQSTLSKSGFSESVGDIDFQSIWGTRSGCRISRVGPNSNAADSNAQGSIFKEGTRRKISREKSNLKHWARLFPGLTAQVYGYNEEGGNASLLVEFLPGCTLDECILTGNAEILENAMFLLRQTLTEVWEATLNREPVQTDYVRQIEARWDSIRRIHPDFYRNRMQIGGRVIESTRALLDGCSRIEAGLRAPFSVLIHGDFNVSNVVYNHGAQRVHFIDMHRSRDFDYIQDISVFLVSNFRIPVFESRLRKRLQWIMEAVFDHADRFAARHQDPTFSLRLALALARSFYTSTRFELNAQFAREMFLRAHLLMEKILQHEGRPWVDFQLPAHVLYL
jgi:phosphate uptake regulator